MSDDGSVPTRKSEEEEEEEEEEEKRDLTGLDLLFADDPWSDDDVDAVEEFVRFRPSSEGQPDEYFLEDDFDSDDESYLPSGVVKADRKLWMKYYRQCYESEGFDIDDFPGTCIMTQFVPILNINRYSYSEKLAHLITLELPKYNARHDESYEFVELVKANMSAGSGLLYHVTFHVKNSRARARARTDAGADAPLEVFQAIILHAVDRSKVQLLRRKPKRLEKK